MDSDSEPEYYYDPKVSSKIPPKQVKKQKELREMKIANPYYEYDQRLEQYKKELENTVHNIKKTIEQLKHVNEIIAITENKKLLKNYQGDKKMLENFITDLKVKYLNLKEDISKLKKSKNASKYVNKRVNKPEVQDLVYQYKEELDEQDRMNKQKELNEQLQGSGANVDDVFQLLSLLYKLVNKK